jgi:tryptophan synthase beta chain
VTDAQAVVAFCRLSEAEGIIPALESAHALAALPELAGWAAAGRNEKRTVIIVSLSGRGDKDVQQVGEYLERQAKGGLGIG